MTADSIFQPPAARTFDLALFLHINSCMCVYVKNNTHTHTHTQACPPPREVVREVGRQRREALILMAAVNLGGSNPLELLMDLVCRSFLSQTLSLSLSVSYTQTHTLKHVCRHGGMTISLWFSSQNVMITAEG